MNRFLHFTAFTVMVIWVAIYMIEFESKEGSDEPDTFGRRAPTTPLEIVKEKYAEYEVIELQEPEEKIEIEKFYDKKNEDYLGSISIPAIGTADSIYRSEGEFYLLRDFNGNDFKPGELYIDDRTGESLNDSGILINGHHVPNGTKFGNFKKLLDLEEQPEVFIWNEELQRVIKYEMLFVSLIDGGTSGIIMNFKNEGQRLQYYRNLYSTAIKQWEQPEAGDQFLLLNSCSYIIQDGHYVVVAKKVG